MGSSSVDILMATHNGEKFLDEQIASIQAQTFSDWRLIVSDDGSSDGTLDIVKRYVSSDSRIRLVANARTYGSAKDNFFALMAESDSDYIMFCDQDDVWLPSKIDTLLLEMALAERAQAGNVPILVLSDMAVVNANLDVLSNSFTKYSRLDPKRVGLNEILAQAVGAGCSFLFNRAALTLAEQCCLQDGVIMHDWWVSLVVACFGCIRYVDVPLVLYRQHSDNTVGAKRFTPLAWLGKCEAMVRSQEAIAKQAACFLATFVDCLDDDKKRTLIEASLTTSSSPLVNLAHLYRSGSWKSGMRKIGQILATLLSNSYKENTACPRSQS